MKKSTLILCTLLAMVSLTACDFFTENKAETATSETLSSEEIASNTPILEKGEMKIFSDFIYDVGPRFNPIKKKDLDTIRSFSDLIGEDHAQRITTYKSLSVVVIEGDKRADTWGMGNTGDFTPAQLELLQSFNYSTNLLIRADYIERNTETGQVVENHDHWTPYLTIVPEKQATYVEGKEALKKYLKDHSEAARAHVDPEKLQPAKLFFTVTKDGTIENTKLDRPSGYPNVDKVMIQLITKTQGLWVPAENTKGEKVDQELVVSFGLMGC